MNNTFTILKKRTIALTPFIAVTKYCSVQTVRFIMNTTPIRNARKRSSSIGCTAKPGLIANGAIKAMGSLLKTHEKGWADHLSAHPFFTDLLNSIQLDLEFCPFIARKYNRAVVRQFYGIAAADAFEIQAAP